MPIDILTTEDLLHETPDAIAKEETLDVTTTLTPDMLRRMNAYGGQRITCPSARFICTTIRC